MVLEGARVAEGVVRLAVLLCAVCVATARWSVTVLVSVRVLVEVMVVKSVAATKGRRSAAAIVGKCIVQVVVVC